MEWFTAKVNLNPSGLDQQLKEANEELFRGFFVVQRYAKGHWDILLPAEARDEPVQGFPAREIVCSFAVLSPRRFGGRLAPSGWRSYVRTQLLETVACLYGGAKVRNEDSVRAWDPAPASEFPIWLEETYGRNPTALRAYERVGNKGLRRALGLFSDLEKLADIGDQQEE